MLNSAKSAYFYGMSWLICTRYVKYHLKVCWSQPHKEGKTSKLQQVWNVLRNAYYWHWLVSNLFLPPGSTSVRTGSWWSCPSWKRRVKVSARSFWSRRSDNAASSSTSSPTPSPTWSGRRWSAPPCRRWWSTSPRTEGCSLSLSILRWVEMLVSTAN